MTNRYDPRNNIPGYIPAAPTLEQGVQGPFPLPSLEGVSNEDMRREIMRRTGQYGPVPRHRARGALGGSFTLNQGAWQTAIRADIWHQDAQGIANGAYQTLSVKALKGAAFMDVPIASSAPLGVICKLRYGQGGTTLNEVIFDVIPNGIVHAPLCAETVIAEVALTPTLIKNSDLSTFDPDNPNVNVFPDATLGVVPIAYVGMVQAQSLPTNNMNMPARQISTVLGAGGSGAVKIPAGAQSFMALGPADLVVTSQVPTTSTDTTTTVPLGARGTQVTLPIGSATINISSTTGGLVTLIFYLGI